MHNRICKQHNNWLKKKFMHSYELNLFVEWFLILSNLLTNTNVVLKESA